MMQSLPQIEPRRGKSYGVEHILSPETGLLSNVLEKTLHLSSEQTAFLLKMGSIYHNQHRLLKSLLETQVCQGDYLRVHQNPRRFPAHLLQVRASIVWENEDLVMLNKPSGLPVHPTVDNTQENIVALFEKEFETEFHVTHRLDVATQGLLILAKNKSAQAKMNEKLMRGELTKHYRARVSALIPGLKPTEGEVIHFMQPSPRAPKIVSAISQPHWQQCRLKILDQRPISENCYQLVIELITGRTHQIRAQLSALGFPICGDQAYGSPIQLASLGDLPYEQIELQAFSLSFEWNGELISQSLSDFDKADKSRVMKSIK